VVPSPSVGLLLLVALPRARRGGPRILFLFLIACAPDHGAAVLFVCSRANAFFL